MVYTPPDSSSVNISLSSGYVPPARTTVDFQLGTAAYTASLQARDGDRGTVTGTRSRTSSLQARDLDSGGVIGSVFSGTRAALASADAEAGSLTGQHWQPGALQAQDAEAGTLTGFRGLSGQLDAADRDRGGIAGYVPPQPAFFDVEIAGTNSPVWEGQTLDVDFTGTNTGDESATQAISLHITAPPSGPPEPVGEPTRWWPMDEGTGYTVEDLTSAPSTHYGVTWVSDPGYMGSYALQTDAINSEYVDTNDLLGTLGSNQGSDYAVVFTLNTVSLGRIMATGVSGTPQVWIVQTNTGWGAGDDTLTWAVRHNVSGDNVTSVSSSTLVTTGTNYRVVLNKVGNTGAGYEIWLNGVYDNPTVHQEFFDPAQATDLTQSLKFFANAAASNFGSHLLDDVIVYDRALTETEIAEDYARQPWA